MVCRGTNCPPDPTVSDGTGRKIQASTK
jgi:hypothetical protein